MSAEVFRECAKVLLRKVSSKQQELVFNINRAESKNVAKCSSVGREQMNYEQNAQFYSIKNQFLINFLSVLASQGNFITCSCINLKNRNQIDEIFGLDPLLMV